jgi:hypothetical protein
MAGLSLRRIFGRSRSLIEPAFRGFARNFHVLAAAMRTRNLSLAPIIPNATPVAFRATRAFFFGHVTTSAAVARKKDRWGGKAPLSSPPLRGTCRATFRRKRFLLTESPCASCIRSRRQMHPRRDVRRQARYGDVMAHTIAPPIRRVPADPMRGRLPRRCPRRSKMRSKAQRILDRRHSTLYRWAPIPL